MHVLACRWNFQICDADYDNDDFDDDDDDFDDDVYIMVTACSME